MSFLNWNSSLLRFLTKNPHLAGTQESKDQALYVAQKWREHGFDKVTIHPYNILLSYPEKPGEVTLKSSNDTVLHDFKVVEPILTADENVSNIVLPFNAYSPAMSVQVRAELNLVSSRESNKLSWTLKERCGKCFLTSPRPSDRKTQTTNCYHNRCLLP